MAPARTPSSGVCLSCCKFLSRPQHPQHTTIRTASVSVLPPADPPPPPPPADLDPETVSRPGQEKRLLRSRVFPIGSRRRRAALQQKNLSNIPFEQLPFQCFQEARKMLQEDRQEKLQEIARERLRIQNVLAQETKTEHDEWKKQNRLRSMRRHLEYLKIQADINDPLVKRRFEDGSGDLTRPIYRHLLNRKYLSPGGKHMITHQRLHQMHIIPDLLPSLTLTADTTLSFHGTKPHSSKMTLPRTSPSASRVPIQPGEFVASAVAEREPRIEVQVFDRGPRLVTIAVVDADVPDLESDSFSTRCHFLACNIPISPTVRSVRLEQLKGNQVVLPWMAPWAQKGSPYHRLAVLVFEQGKPKDENVRLDEMSGSTSGASTSSWGKTGEAQAREVIIRQAEEVRHVLLNAGGAATAEGEKIPELNADGTAATPVPVPDKTSDDTTVRTIQHGRTLYPQRQLSMSLSAPQAIDVKKAGEKVQREGFSMRAFASRHDLSGVGGHLFRVQWDEWMDGVMSRMGVEEVGVELRRKRGEKLPYRKKDGARYR